MIIATQANAFDDTNQDVEAAPSYKALPLSVQREIERLTEVLFFAKSAPNRPSILMIDMDSHDESSLWLATGVASVLGSLLRRAIYVLSVEKSAKPSDAPRLVGQSSHTANYRLERITASALNGDVTSALADRLHALQAEGQRVIVHLSSSELRGAVLSRADGIEGVVLLVRASRTRKAAVEALERQLSAAGIPLLGSVLLDRTHPIPEKLYKLL